jgi:hypothetical protein
MTLSPLGSLFRSLSLVLGFSAIATFAQTGTFSSVVVRTQVYAQGARIGFTITGVGSKTVLIRGVGPSLANPGTTGFLDQPALIVSSASTQPIAINTRWNNDPAIVTASSRVGASTLRLDSFDSALLLTLPPGQYAVTMLNLPGDTGIAQLELYDADAGTPTATFSQMSIRGPAGASGNSMGVSVKITGASMPALIRALGPALNLVGSIADPALSVLNSQGTTVATNDNWPNDPILVGLAAQAGAVSLISNSTDSALLTTLSPGIYTAVVNDVGGTLGTAEIQFIAVGAYSIAPTFPVQPSAESVFTSGTTATLSVQAVGYPSPSYQWYKDGTAISGATSSSFVIAGVQATDAGQYVCVATNTGGSLMSTSAHMVVGPSAWLSNLSVRTKMEVGQTLTTGATVFGGSRDVLIRASGPALAPFGVSPLLPDPKLSVFDAARTKINENDDWSSTLTTTFASVGAFGFPAGSHDAALVQRLTGSVSVQVTGSGSGIVLVEAYDLGLSSVPRLTNLSVLGRSGTGSDVLVAGFTIRGEGTKDLLIRGVGPGLNQFGVSSNLVDPKLEIYDSNQKLVAQNDTWDASITDTTSKVGAFSLPAKSTDAALVITLPPGSYSAVVRGSDGGTGDALIEVYEVR